MGSGTRQFRGAKSRNYLPLTKKYQNRAITFGDCAQNFGTHQSKFLTRPLRISKPKIDVRGVFQSEK